ncbi:uncharacterized protein LOC126562936 [Anopheles maculipalpis]|uniref:uncharacterized protein LOC126562936 n=1 Tax=Anopheles maculipalpis TaxID=1496333 RepID=UPI002159579E|nr:uncharacterized protein LOC126562936 [Anopheles maculipalpis]
MANSRCKTEQNDSAFTTTALECAVKFLERYPELTQFVVCKSSYQFDILSLIFDATRMNLQEEVDDILKEFSTNGTSSELCVEAQCPLEPTDKDKESTNVEEPVNETAECDVLQDITNHAKEKRKFRKTPNKNNSKAEHCVFCLNNGATKAEYESHQCKDEWGDVICPVLQKFVCSRCNASGKNAHTAKYCPEKPIITLEDCVAIEKRWEQTRRRKMTKDAKYQRQSTPVTKASTRLRL